MIFRYSNYTLVFFMLGVVNELLVALENSPLLLTPYIQQKRILEGRELAFVSHIHPKVPSYSGFLTVNKKCNANLWFWFFPSRNDPQTDPVTVWLNGGPGLSSMFGLFLENGPYFLSRSGELKLRKLSWTANSSVIYVDNPVGTGFSFAKKECYSRNQVHVGKNFLAFLEQFFALFPELKNNLFYLFGESYAGKYVTAIAYNILNSNTSVRLDGIGIGNGVIDPRSQEVYAENLYELGIIDRKMKNHIMRKENLLRDLIDQKKFGEASSVRGKINRRHRPPTGYKHWYNYLRSNYGHVFYVDYDAFLNRPNIREALHVGNSTRNNETLVTKMLSGEIMQSVRTWFEYIVERRRTLLYYGQMDLTVSYAGALNFIRSMNWSGAEAFRDSPRKLWESRGKLAGYIKSAETLTEVLVRNAGHNVPTDQPAWAFVLYNKFIFNKTDKLGIPVWSIKNSLKYEKKHEAEWEED